MEKKNNQLLTALILGVVAVVAALAVIFVVIKPFGSSTDAKKQGDAATSDASETEDSTKEPSGNIFDKDTSEAEEDGLKERLEAVKAVDLSKTDALAQEKAIFEELVSQAEDAVKEGDAAKAEPLIVHCENVQKALTGQSSGLSLGKVQQLVKGGLTVDATVADGASDSAEPVFNVYEKANDAKEFTWVSNVKIEKTDKAYKLSFTPTADEDGNIKATYIVTCQGDLTYARAKADFTATAAKDAKKEKDDSSEKEKEKEKAKKEAEEKKKKEEEEAKKEESSESQEESANSIETDTGDWSQMLYGTSEYYLVESDIDYLTPWQLMIGRNEIYARHGRLFNDAEIQEYFNGKAWYNGYIRPEDFDESVLSDVERANLDLIRKVENGGSEPEPEKDWSYVLSGSSDRYLTDSDVSGLSSWQLMIARNEIFARHGRRFSDPDLQAYFDGKAWYNGTIAPEDFNGDAILSAIEQANLDLIRKYE